MRNIKVEYDGKYPNACSGTLKITVDETVVYNKDFCCSSTGSVWFDEDWSEHVECGELIWKDSEKFDDEIQQAVKDVLSTVGVCCGGCV